MRTGEHCNVCGAEMVAEFVDIGIGWQQVTPGDCPNDCGYVAYEYSEYVKRTKNPLTMESWLDSLQTRLE